jgi:hypothetical protein
VLVPLLAPRIPSAKVQAPRLPHAVNIDFSPPKIVRGPGRSSEQLRVSGRNEGAEGSIVLVKVRQTMAQNCRLQRPDRRIRGPGDLAGDDPTKIDPERGAERGLDRWAASHHRVRGGSNGKKESRPQREGLRAAELAKWT